MVIYAYTILKKLICHTSSKGLEPLPLETHMSYGRRLLSDLCLTRRDLMSEYVHPRVKFESNALTTRPKRLKVPEKLNAINNGTVSKAYSVKAL